MTVSDSGRNTLDTCVAIRKRLRVCRYSQRAQFWSAAVEWTSLFCHTSSLERASPALHPLTCPAHHDVPSTPWHAPAVGAHRLNSCPPVPLQAAPSNAPPLHQGSPAQPKSAGQPSTAQQRGCGNSTAAAACGTSALPAKVAGRLDPSARLARVVQQERVRMVGSRFPRKQPAHRRSMPWGR